MKIGYQKQSNVWWVCDNDCWYICCAYTPKEARRKARQWWMYMTAPTDELSDKYLTGEIHVK